VRLRFDQADFVFSPSLPQNFARQNSERFEAIHPLPDLLPGSTIVRVSISARSDFEAYHKATESLDFLRGIWNYRINRGVVSRWYTGPVKPVNEIRLGPVHTLHLPSGQEVSSLFWYELLSPTESTVEQVKNWDEIRDEEKRISEIIDKSSYRAFLKNMFIRYARSLDSSDHEASFLKLWSLLEYVTAIENRADYDELIRRTLFLSVNEDYDKRILEHLRIRRNATVHRGEASSQIETFIFQLKRYVDRVMLFHLQFGYQFSTAEKFGNLLSKPRDPEVLKTRIAEIEADAALHRVALQARTPPPFRVRKHIRRRFYREIKGIITRYQHARERANCMQPGTWALRTTGPRRELLEPDCRLALAPSTRQRRVRQAHIEVRQRVV